MNTTTVLSTTPGASSRSAGGGRALLPVDPVVGVVAHEAIAGAGHLERHRADQQQPQEQVQPDELADTDDGDSEDGEQDDEQDAGDRRQLLVALGPSAQREAARAVREADPAVDSMAKVSIFWLRLR